MPIHQPARYTHRIVHAGFDDKPGSVRAKYCRPGNELFPQLDRELHFGFQRNGSLVVAKSQEQMKTLHELYARGLTNGVKNMRVVKQVRRWSLDVGRWSLVVVCVGVWFVVRGALCVVHRASCIVCCAVYAVRCALCAVYCALCTVPCALCAMLDVCHIVLHWVPSYLLQL